MDHLSISLIVAGFTAAGVLIAFQATQWRKNIWLSQQFTKIRDMLDELKTDLIKKLEYHERHDDRRFAELSDDVWELRVRNAAVDGNGIYRKRLDHWQQDDPFKGFPQNGKSGAS